MRNNHSIVSSNKNFFCASLSTYEERQLLFRFDVYDEYKIDDENPWSVKNLKDIINNEVVGLNESDRLRTYLIFDDSGEKEELACVFCLRTNDLLLGDETVPSIELAYFAMEKSYKKKHSDYEGVGRYFFNVFILPIIETTYHLTGGVFLHLFAINNKKLVSFYKKLGFISLEEKDDKEILSYEENEGNQDCKFLFIQLVNYL